MRNKIYIVVMIPAWNEEGSISATLESVRRQTRKADKIVVVVNNTTDHTAERARENGAEVVIMPGYNQYKKAGAINFGLDKLQTLLDSKDEASILVMDADTTIEPDFIEASEKMMLSHETIGGVGSIFSGRRSRSILGTFQSMEFSRYALVIKRRPEVFVLSGTASLFHWEALKLVKEARRDKLLPGGESFYDVYSVTEDNEMTLAILKLGYSCPTCGVESTTDVMETMTDLLHQRKRWYLGAMQNVRDYGRRMPLWMRFVYWRQQIGLFLSLLVAPILLFAFIAWMATGDSMPSFWRIYLVIFIVYLLVQVATVWKVGWKARIMALTIFPEIFYSYLLMYFYLVALISFLRNEENQWRHT